MVVPPQFSIGRREGADSPADYQSGIGVMSKNIWQETWRANPVWWNIGCISIAILCLIPLVINLLM